MSKTKLDYCKKALRIDFSDSDDVLQQMLNAAESRICRDTQRSMKELCAMSVNGLDFPYDLQQAAVALTGAWFNEPEAYTTMSVQSISEAYSSIISPYLKLV